MKDIIKGSTKRGQRILAMADAYIGENLWDAYSSFSHDKAKAYEKCRRLCYEDNGYNFHICSANTYQFTVSWEYTNEETGEIMTVVRTANNHYVVDGSRREED